MKHNESASVLSFVPDGYVERVQDAVLRNVGQRIGDATVLVEDGHVDVMAGQLHETEVAKRGDQLLGVTVRLQINDGDHSEMLVRS